MPHWPAPPSMHIDHYLNNASNKCYRRLCVSVVHEKRRGGGERKRDWKRLLNDRENCPPSFYRHRSPLIKIFRYFEQDWRRPCFKTCHCKGCTGCLGKFLMFGWIQFSLEHDQETMKHCLKYSMTFWVLYLYIFHNLFFICLQFFIIYFINIYSHEKYNSVIIILYICNIIIINSYFLN